MLRLVPYFCYIGFYFTFWYKTVQTSVREPRDKFGILWLNKNRLCSKTCGIDKIFKFK